MQIAQEEVFGPVLVVIAYTDDDDAVRIANNSIYGLSGAVFNAAKERALDAFIARRIGFLQMTDVVAGTLDRVSAGAGLDEGGYSGCH